MVYKVMNNLVWYGFGCGGCLVDLEVVWCECGDNCIFGSGMVV